MNKGRLVVIDGLDGTGKATQVEEIRKHLISIGKIEHHDFCVVSFPRYNHISATMVQQYLNSYLGKNPDDVDLYTASEFYSIDRSISYHTEEWGDMYKDGGLVIADRYTSSNVIHQASKLKIHDPKSPFFYRSEEFTTFVRWLYMTEYEYMRIPKPDLVINLKMSDEANSRMLEARKAKEGGDIHENNHEYLNRCRAVMDAFEKLVSDHFTLNKYNIWDIMYNIPHMFLRVDNDDHTPKSIEEVHDMIWNTITAYNNIII